MAPVHKFSAMGSLTTNKIDYPSMLAGNAAFVDTAYDAVGTGVYAPGSSDYDMRRSTGVEVRVLPLLGAANKNAPAHAATGWYLKVKELGEDEPIKVFHREGLKIDSTEDFDTRKRKVRGSAAWAIGWTDPVGKWRGSKGDGQAYAG